MIRPALSDIEVYLCIEPVDFRKQINGLSLWVESAMSLDPLTGVARLVTFQRFDVEDGGGAEILRLSRCVPCSALHSKSGRFVFRDGDDGEETYRLRVAARLGAGSGTSPERAAHNVQRVLTTSMLRLLFDDVFVARTAAMVLSAYAESEVNAAAMIRAGGL